MAALSFTGALPLLRRVRCWSGVVVLSYHRIGDPSQHDTNRGLFSASSDELDRHLRAIKKHFDLVSPQDFDESLLAAPGRHVLITFDDGYRDLYEQAHPVLRANGVSAALFPCTGFIDGRAAAWWDEIAWMLRRARVESLAPGPWSAERLPLEDATREQTIQVVTRAYWSLKHPQTGLFLEQLAEATESGRRPPSHDWVSWDMVRELQAAGHEIGGHTDTHPVLANVSEQQQAHEISSCMQRLREELGSDPRLFAYPVGVRGAFDATTSRLAAESGIRYAFSNYGGWVSRKGFSALDVRRTPSEMLRTPALFSATLSLPQVLARAPS